MSPNNKKKLTKLRKSLDKLDNSFIKLIKKRTALVKQDIKLKESKKEINDKKHKPKRLTTDMRLTSPVINNELNMIVQLEYQTGHLISIQQS